MTIHEFIEQTAIRLDVTPADSNPNMEGSENMNNYRCTLRHGKYRMTIPFSTGRGWTHDPEAADVLSCLASDAAGYENASSFEDWCSEYGYDTDSRKAEKTYKVCGTQAGKLKRLLGDELYEHLLYKVDPL